MTTTTVPSADGAGGGAAERYCPTCEKSFPGATRCPDDGTQLVLLGPDHDRLIGQSLDGRYTILERIGQGGMGAVYRATQHSVGRDVAIKVVRPDLFSDPTVIKRFLREAKLASRLTHPNAVAVVDFGQTTDGLFYLVMELLDGEPLDRVLRRDGKLAPERAINIASQICDALDGAHQLQIIHRDLKPGNVMLLSGAGGRDLVKVLDFGLAKSLTADIGTQSVTRSGAMLGTPAYMPPELAVGRDADERTDLYSLGCILYVMLTGRLPFIAESLHELVSKHANDVAPPVTGVAPALAAVVARLLEKEPDDRYANASAVHQALDAALGGRSSADPSRPGGSADAMFGSSPSGRGRGTAGSTPPPTATTAFEETAASDEPTPATPSVTESVLAQVAPAALRHARGERPPTGPARMITDSAPPEHTVAPAAVPVRPAERAESAADPVRPAERAEPAADPAPRRMWIGAVVVVAALGGAVVWWVNRDGGARSAVAATDAAALVTPGPIDAPAATVEIVDAAPTVAATVDAPAAAAPDARSKGTRPPKVDAAARIVPPGADAAPRIGGGSATTGGSGSNPSAGSGSGRGSGSGKLPFLIAMRARLLHLVAVAPLAACLSKPGRPPGEPDAADSDAGTQPSTTVFRKYAYAVADLNTDGYDDLLRWGNTAAGVEPRVWVMLGSATGTLGAPDIEIDVQVNGTRAWYEVLDVAVDDIDPGHAGPELLVLTAEDDDVPTGPTGNGRHVIAQVFPNPTVGGNAIGRATPLDGYDNVGGVATDPFPVYIVGRRTSALGQSIVFGALDHNMFRIDNLTGPDFGQPIPSFLLDGGTPIDNVQDLFDVDAVDGDEQLVAVTHALAWHSDGDPTGDTFTGPSTVLPDQGERSVLPLYKGGQPFLAAATLNDSDKVQVVVDEVPPTALARYELTLDQADPTYLAIGYIGGTGQFDIAVLTATGALEVYRDLRLDGGGTVQYDMVVGGPNDLAGYDLVVVGNFSGLAGTEIYALGDIDHPPRCMTMTTADVIDNCPP